MKLELKRITKDKTKTLGELYVNGEFFCHTLEDVDRGLTSSMEEKDIRNIKVHGKTAIPTGTYQVVVNWSNNFRQFMPLLLNVKGFLGIRIHSGNTEADSNGCILVGEKSADKLIRSRVTYQRLFKLIQTAVKKEKIHIFIYDYN